MQPTRTLYVQKLLSAVHRGTAFENRSLTLLRDHLSMSLTRVGGKSDGGVDLMGWWWVPEFGHLHSEPEKRAFDHTDADATLLPERIPRRRLRVLAQCKAEKKKMGPAYLRELEGVVYKHVASDGSQPPSHAESSSPRPAQPLVALLISQSPFTRACLLAAQSSPVPLFLVHLPHDLAGDSDATPADAVGGIGQVFGNPALVSTAGVLRGEVEIRWERLPNSDGGLGRPGLWWRGQRLDSWTPDDTQLENGL
ncbi:hypothetical protein BV25DRAFT_1919509 [Artomyces pyxidatus]|uniref:Uncharacterized protein n=1 Tax=Artomyces pyxidatus TaxID=48021 RepID=A0ACB8SPW5_9AGAM|nr:hypothetical protein BV25DRAFT_1919509 [Artomyces pyxidatus]